MALVFQYGSNATSGRLNGPRRLSGQARVLGRAETIEDFDIAFDVYSRTNGCAASNLVQMQGRKAWGVLFEIPDEFVRGSRTDGLKTLAEIEGASYVERSIRVRDADGQEREAITFVVKDAERREGLATSAAYVSWIVYGLRDRGVPEDYLSHVIEVALATNRRAEEQVAEQTRLIRKL